MKLEAGKKYVRRDGLIIEIIRSETYIQNGRPFVTPGGATGWVVGGGWSYYRDGRYAGRSSESSVNQASDLVGVASEPRESYQLSLFDFQ